MSEDVLEYTNISAELERYGTYASRTSGISMRPLFKTHRDVVVIKKPERELKKYDVVLYKNKSGQYILHRIIKIRPDCYVIRGDNTYSKEYVKKEDVIGVLVAFNRKGKRHTADEFGYKFYSRFWNFIYPVRAFFVKIRIILSKIYHKIFKRKSK